MATVLHTRINVLVFFFCLLAGITSLLPADLVTSTWSGAASDNYWYSLNWVNGAIPFNDLWDDYIADIPGGGNVTYNMNWPIELFGMTMGSDSTLSVEPGSDINIMAQGIFNGIISVDDASLIAQPGGDYLITGNRARMFVDNGVLSLPVMGGYASTGLLQSDDDGSYETKVWDLFGSTGTGSLLDLSSLTSMNLGFNETVYGNSYRDTCYQRITAGAGGKIDFSGVTRITGPVRSQDWVEFNCSGDAEIDLGSLQQVTSAGSGTVRFNIARDLWEFPVLTSVNRMQVSMTQPSSILNMPVLSTLSNSSISLSADSLLNADELVQLSSSSLTLGANSRFNGGLHSIDASTFYLDSSSEVILPDLTEANLDIYWDGNEDTSYIFRAPELISFSGSRSKVKIDAMNVFETGGLQDINNAQLFVNGGRQWGVISGDVVAESYASTGLLQSDDDGSYETKVWDLFGSTGTGSLLDLSSLTSMNLGFNETVYGNSYRDTCYQRISAGAGGKIDFSGVTRITGPVRSQDWVEFNCSGDAEIDLGSLQQVTSAGSGTVRFNIARDLWEFPVLTSVNRMQVSMTQPSSILNMPVLSTLSNSSISLSADSLLNADELVQLSSSSLTLGANSRFNGGLHSIDASTFYLDSSSEVILPDLTEANLDIYWDGNEDTSYIFRAPELISFSGSRSKVKIDAMNVFETGGLQDINNAQLFVNGGRQWGVISGDVVAESYASTGLLQSDDDGSYETKVWDLFGSTGTGSLLDLSSLTSMNLGFNETVYGNSYRDTCYQRITAGAGGKIDFSGVTRITGPVRSQDWVEFNCSGDAEIDLGSLQQVTSAGSGTVRFNIARDLWEFPVLTSVNRMQVSMTQPSSILNMPAVSSIANASLSLAADSQFNAGELGSLSNSSITLGANSQFYSGLHTISASTFYLDSNSEVVLPDLTGANLDIYWDGNEDTSYIFRAPELISFSGSRSKVKIDAMNVFETGGLQDINNAQLFVNGGRQWGVISGDVVAGSYASTGLLQSDDDGSYETKVWDLFGSTGTGSLLDLSSLTSMNLGFNETVYGNSYRDTCYQRITAGAGGKIDFSGVTRITGPVRSQDWVEFNCSGDAEIDLGSLQQVTSAGSGVTKFNINNSRLRLGNIYSSGNAQFNMVGYNALVFVEKDLLLGSSTTISSSEMPILAIAGNYSFAHQVETSVNLEDARLIMTGELPRSIGGDSMALPAAMCDDGPMEVEPAVSNVENTYVNMLAGGEFSGMADAFLALASGQNAISADSDIQPAGPTDWGDIWTDDPNDPQNYIQYLEVGCSDGGLEQALTDNFAIGQLVVGQTSQSTMVCLSDLVNNGNRGSLGRESLYLAGNQTTDGLRIIGGSTLILNDIRVYARIEGAMALVNELIPDGETVAPFDQGFIALDLEAATTGYCGSLDQPRPLADVNCNCRIDLVDFAAVSAQWLDADCYLPDWCGGADVNMNGMVDLNDIMMIDTEWLK